MLASDNMTAAPARLPVSRRRFLGSLGKVATATVALSIHSRAFFEPADVGRRSAGATPDIRIGYAAITWGDNEKQSIEDISSLGYAGIQMRANAVRDFQPTQLRELLQQHKLQMVALSSGNVHSDPAAYDSDIALHLANAKFLRDVDGLYLQVLDQVPKGQHIEASNYQQLARLLNELGRRTADLEIALGYHNHLNSLSERPEGMDRLFDAVDPRYTKLVFDIAHYQAGGGGPVEAVKKYKDRLLFLHLKDLGEPNPQARRPLENFVELGRGKINLPGFFDALREIKFRGWAIVELDSEPDKTRTPKESALISKQYLEEKLGFKI